MLWSLPWDIGFALLWCFFGAKNVGGVWSGSGFLAGWTPVSTIKVWRNLGMVGLRILFSCQPRSDAFSHVGITAGPSFFGSDPNGPVICRFRQFSVTAPGVGC